MTRRAGATLMEVLVSIFIMGIGLLAILALFPLGALSMAQAIKDDRAAATARNGAAVAQALDLRDDPIAVAAMLDPTPGGVLKPAAAGAPSYPVFLDPIGVQTYLTPAWVGNVPGVPRRAPVASYNAAGTALDNAKILKWFSLTDDIRFNPDGVPPTPMDREGAYSYGLMLRRPVAGAAGVVDISVVVYFRRPLTPGANFQGAEYFFSENEVGYTPGSNVITIDTKGRAAPLRPGAWLLDCTVKQGPDNGYAHGQFYRAVSVNEVAPNVFEVEVAPAIRGFPAGATTPGRVVVMEGVIEVIERGTGWRP